MNIREMQAQDYNAVYSLWMSCAGMGLNDVDDSEKEIARFLRRNPGTCFVAEAENNIIGAILAGNDGRRGYIYHTAVHPDFRGRGIARQLVEATVDGLKNEGISKAALVVFSRNEGGNAFWERMGFSVRSDLMYRNKALAHIARIDT